MTAALVRELVSILRRAAAVIRDVSAGPFAVEYKGPGDPVTPADRRANELICEALARRFPGIPVVAEESAAESFDGFREAPTVLFVDPLDGTREFVGRRHEFVTMIGLLDGARAILGVVVDPTTDVAYWGGPSLGAARLDENDGASPLRTSQTTCLAEAHVVASRQYPAGGTGDLARRFGVRSLATLGSAGMKGIAVASGAADAYVAPRFGGKRWDACAIDALVTGAGGRFSDANGEPVDYRGPGLLNDQGLLGTNGRLHDALLERLAPLRRKP